MVGMLYYPCILVWDADPLSCQRSKVREALIGAVLDVGCDTPVAGFTSDLKGDGLSKIFGQQIDVQLELLGLWPVLSYII